MNLKNDEHMMLTIIKKPSIRQFATSIPESKRAKKILFGDAANRSLRLLRPGVAFALWPFLSLILLYRLFLIFGGGVSFHLSSGAVTTTQEKREVLKTALSVCALIGATLGGVNAYRKQRVSEEECRRGEEQRFGDRFSQAAEQLGHDKAATRMAGLYAMAQLADDWDDQRQTCIDVLCGYLRLPPEKDSSGEKEIRSAILSIFHNRLKNNLNYTVNSKKSWIKYEFDFSDVVFEEKTSFSEWGFCRVSFQNAIFKKEVEFNSAEFGEGDSEYICADFRNVRFLSEVSFRGVHFCGETSFEGARFEGAAEFGEAAFDWYVNFSNIESRVSLIFNESQFTYPPIFSSENALQKNAPSMIEGFVSFKESTVLMYDPDSPLNNNFIGLNKSDFLYPDKVILGPFYWRNGV
jgi:hypothetical protein